MLIPKNKRTEKEEGKVPKQWQKRHRKEQRGGKRCGPAKPERH